MNNIFNEIKKKSDKIINSQNMIESIELIFYSCQSYIIKNIIYILKFINKSAESIIIMFKNFR